LILETGRVAGSLVQNKEERIRAPGARPWHRTYSKTGVSNGNHKEQQNRKRKRAEKEEKLTTRTRVSLGKPEEDLTDRISPATEDEEEDAAVSVVYAGSIPSWRTERTTY
jgi:predicted transcriptional regulator